LACRSFSGGCETCLSVCEWSFSTFSCLGHILPFVLIWKFFFLRVEERTYTLPSPSGFSFARARFHFLPFLSFLLFITVFRHFTNSQTVRVSFCVRACAFKNIGRELSRCGGDKFLVVSFFFLHWAVDRVARIHGTSFSLHGPPRVWE